MESHRTYSRLKCENELVNSKASYNHSVKLGWRFSRFSHVQLFVTSMAYSLPGSSVRWNSPGKNTGVGCHALLQEIFPTQGLNLALLHRRQIPCHLSHQGSPISLYPFIFFPYWQICFFNLYQYLPGISIRFFFSAECHCSIPMNRTRQG